MNFEKFYYILELIGTVAFASSGAMIAIRKGMDVFGIIVLSIITAVGGGIFRDLVLGINPPIAFLQTIYTTVSVVSATAVIIIYKLIDKKKFLNMNFLLTYVKIISVLDAIGLGIFTMSGVNLAWKMAYGSNRYLPIFVGMVTGCGGGVVRDLCAGAIPIIFTKNTIYAMASLLGAVAFILSRQYFRHYAYLLGVIVVIVVRLLSMKYRWSLPDVRSDLIEDGPDQ